ncbi:hypothetical protein AJ78_03765 [Emergomyces pasteurianus Ep9510]|uniref:Uncharacterized protein n=1 Tax=Emergomyces pasteurianus Ep9510 TaxID=1447872 RepID=A0A1J9QJI1_9EURO|nr:hypothetical protein AJ78_03765 [Emergomyces pasteurianus Ep9510]
MKINSPTTLVLPLLSMSFLYMNASAGKSSRDTFSSIHAGCCPGGPEFSKAISHPNATGVFPVVGLQLDDDAISTPNNNPPSSIPPPKNWTWTTTVSEVPMGSSNDGTGRLYSTNQVFTLDIPIDEDIYSSKHNRNVCVLLLKMVSVNQNDPGTCENIFPRAKIESMREDLVRRVGDMTTGQVDTPPCAGTEEEAWQDIISFYHRSNHTLATRNTTIAAQYHTLTTTPHPSTDHSTYDAALIRTQPIFLLGYSVDPKILAGPAIVKRELAETRLTCVRVREVLKGSRGGDVSGAHGGVLGLGRGSIVMWLGFLGGWLVFLF